jgi:hypothetical protein
MLTLSIDIRPRQLSDFETGVLERLRLRAAAMPDGVVRFVSSTPATGVRYPERGFLLMPTRANAAAIRGYVAGDVPNREGVGAEILVTVGEAAVGEFAIRPSPSEVLSDVEKFMRVCEAVISTRFSERVTYDASGRVVRSRLTLQVNDEKVVLSTGALLPNPFRRTFEKELQYEPYY